MSETDTIEQETVEVSAVEELINQITDGELNKAEGSFQSIIQDKMSDALESQRIATAQAIFNDADVDVEDDSDITDEEIEDVVDQVMDEDEEILAALDDEDTE
jgi:hypothetical protein